MRYWKMNLGEFTRAAFFKANGKSYLKKETKGGGGKLTFSHVAYHLAHNVGDTTLSQCVRRTFNCLSDISEWKLIPLRPLLTNETIGTINKTDRLIIGGGGLFLPDTNPNSANTSGWLWPVTNEQLDRIEVPVAVFSVGYNYFSGQEPDELFIDSLNHLAAKADFFGLRSWGSANATKKLLKDEYRDKVIFQPCTTNLIRKVFAGSLSPKEERKNVGLNIAFDREDRRFGDDREQILTQLAECAKKISDMGYNVFCISHRDGDEKIRPYLDRAGVSYKFADFSRQYPDKIIKFYNSMDVVIGMRTHSQMIPFGVNCEIISLGTHEKIRWFLEDFDALDWYVDLNEDCAHIAERVTDVFAQIHEKDRIRTRERLLSAQEEFWKITQENIKRIDETA